MSTDSTMGKEGEYKLFCVFTTCILKVVKMCKAGKWISETDFHEGSQNLTQTEVTAQQSLNNILFLYRVETPDLCHFFLKAESS